MKLPNALRAWVEAPKIQAYLLNLNHPKGGSKARFFIRHGFNLEHWQQLADAFIFHAWTGEATFAFKKKRGDMWTVLGPMPCPSGKQPLVLSVWCVENDIPRLVSAYPG